MKLILSAVDEALATAWHLFCGDLDFIELHHGSILDVECDAIVSPANSFGFMDGGVDAVYRDRFGTGLQTRVQKQIADRHHGELLVGAAELVETEDDAIPFMIVAPTMRVPMILKESVNAYLAARAVLLLVKYGTLSAGSNEGASIAGRIKRLAFPGMGTGVGKLGANTCARQLRQAIEDVLLGSSVPPRSWVEASERHQLLYTNVPKRLQRDDSV